MIYSISRLEYFHKRLIEWRFVCQESQATGTTQHDGIDSGLYATARPDDVPPQSTKPANDVTTSQAPNDGLYANQAITTYAAVDYSKKTAQKPKSDKLKAVDTRDIEVHITK